MEDSYGNRTVWRFLDGSISISVSMLIAVGLNNCGFCTGFPVLDFLHELTTREDGVIIVATLLLFPTAAVMYGVSKMIFAAKEAVERKARAKGRQEGLEQGTEQGRQEERERIRKLLAEHGVALSPEVLSSLNRNGDSE